MMRLKAAEPTLWLLPVWLFAAGCPVLLAQHAVQPLDVAEGANLYKSTCVLCHGPEGRSVPGVNLGSGPFRHASSDDDLVRLIREGIRGTAMPAIRVSQREAANIVAYLHSMQAAPEPESLSGEAERGKAIFDGKGNCLQCHRVHGVGGTVSPGLNGPNLGGIGRIRKRNELLQSILDPDVEVLFSYRMFRGTTRKGTAVTGRLLNEDAFRVQIIDQDGHLLSLAKGDLREYELVGQSPMPSYRDKLTPEELADLVAYLASL